ncbi:hypothetical protein GGF32_006405 [Allomyces javanicus]|nr:hypothetical protein GGF32_006405 [Allomyces javanicus]
MTTPPLSPVLDLSFTARERRHSLAAGASLPTSPFSLFGGMPTSPTAALFASPPSSLLMSLSPTSASVNSATARSAAPASSAVVLPPVHTQVGFAPVGSESTTPTSTPTTATASTTAAPSKTRRRTKTTPAALGSPGEPASFQMSQVSFGGGKFW